jgi:hypothetical protein
MVEESAIVGHAEFSLLDMEGRLVAEDLEELMVMLVMIGS